MGATTLARRRSAGAVAFAAVCLSGGYTDLAVGGLTLGPILLVLGYCVGVPAALLVGGTRAG
jgi:hypothetical protein